MSKISCYPRIGETIPDKEAAVDLFLEDVRSGTWQDEVFRIAQIADKEERQKAKRSCRYVTLSGTFSQRAADCLIQHSGFIGMDVDDLTLDEIDDIRSYIGNDEYVYAAFVSISGTGMCFVFKIDGKRHLDAFLGLQSYLWDKYKLQVDVTGKDVSRARYVSFDPHLYLNEHAKRFAIYPKAEPKKKHSIKEIVYVRNDFEYVLKQITERQIDITGSYPQWLKLCFALVDKFGESGREYFHFLSQFSSKYTPKDADRQYDNCLKSQERGYKSGATISSFFYLAKDHGCEITSQQTKLVTMAAQTGKRSGLKKEDIVKNLSEHTGIPADESSDIIDQVFDNDAKGIEEDNPVDLARIWVQQTQDIRFNVVTGLFENYGQPLTDRAEVSLQLDMKRALPDIDLTIIKMVIKQGGNDFHPIKDFFERYSDRPIANGTINKLLSGLVGPQGQDYIQRFGHKWLVGLVAGVFGEVSPIFWCLCGETMGTGKTRFFRDLLPPELRLYVSGKSLGDLNTEAARRDFEIAMSRYLLIYDDEMSGKSKRDEKRIKAILSMTDSTHRAAFGRNEERRPRLCGFGGTSNDLRVIGWDVDNRRMIPVEISRIDFAALNSVDRIDLLMEAYALYRSGFNYEILGEEIRDLNAGLDKYKQVNFELELCASRFVIGSPEATFFTLADIKRVLEAGGKEVYSVNKISAALRDMGGEFVAKKVAGVVLRGYWLTVR